jgi:lysozyme
MSYLDLARSLIQRLESCKLVGYPDSAGIPTNGYGHTGPEVRIGAPVSQDIAEHDLDIDLATADHRLSTVCYPSSLARLADHQRAALVAFVFNVGAKDNWQIWKDIDGGDLADVPAQLRRFTKATVNGQLVDVAGLEHRREAEIIFWNTADLAVAASVAQTANAVAAPPSGYTRAADTPPAPAPAPPLAATSLAAKVTTAVAGAAMAGGSAAQQIHGVVSPYVDKAKVFATLDTIAVGAIVAAGIVGVMIHVHQAERRAV